MDQQRKVTVLLFGALRNSVPEGNLSLDLPVGARLSDLRKALSRFFSERGMEAAVQLLNHSAVGTSDRILKENETLPPDSVAVLPPVSGG